MTHFRLNFTLILLTVIFIGLICLTNEDPIFREYFFNNVDLENFHTKAAFKFLYDSSVGGIISILFYILFVQIPANKSRKRIKKNLEQQFKYFKKTCIIIILGVGKNIFDFDLVEKLLDQNQFRLYFNSPSKISGQTHWHYFLNNVDQ